MPSTDPANDLAAFRAGREGRDYLAAEGDYSRYRDAYMAGAVQRRNDYIGDIAEKVAKIVRRLPLPATGNALDD